MPASSALSKNLLLSLLLAGLCSACSAVPPDDTASVAAEPERPDAALAAIEARSGGRLGAVVLDASGRQVLEHRAGERFAFCSAFKLPLAAVVLAEAELGRLDPDRALPITSADVLGHSPVIEALVDRGAASVSVAEAARAAVVESDNAAANLLLAQIGGPTGFNRLWRNLVQDEVTRLDRTEPALNSNVPGDARDTSTPGALARAMERLFGQSALASGSVERLVQWTADTQTGRARVRAALPSGWTAGDKTGSCSPGDGEHPQYNDIGWLRDGRGRLYLFAVMLDHPRTGWDDSQAVIADVGRLAVQRIDSAP